MSDPQQPKHDDGESQNLRLGNTSLRVSKQGIGITLQTSTLLALLGIGWQAKGALEDQLEQTERTRIELEERYAELDRSIADINTKLAAAAATSQQITQVQLDLAGMRIELVAAERRFEAIERHLERARGGGSP